MSVEKSMHPRYEAMLPKWKRMRDAAAGEDAIKEAGEKYLPMPDGMRADKVHGGAAYAAYKARAKFPDVVQTATNGLSGVLHQKPAKIKIPPALEPMLERATQDGLTLEGFHRRITHEIMTTGRYGIHCDVNKAGKPYFAGYTAETILNWHVGDDERVDFINLDETGPQFDPETGGWTTEDVKRVLSLKDGVWAVRVFRKNILQDDVVQPAKRAAKVWNSIPFVFVDAYDLTPDPSSVPLDGLARTAISIYQLTADYRKTLYQTAQPQPWVSGMQQPDGSEIIVGDGIWFLPSPEARAGILEFEGKAIAAQRTAIQDEYAEAALQGARMFENDTRQAESGEALKTRYAAKTATLLGVARTSAAALEASLKNAAEWIGANPDEVEVEPHIEFLDHSLSSQDLTALVDAWLKGAISKETLFHNLKAGGIAPEDRDFEDEEDLIDAEGPLLGDVALADTLEDDPEGEREAA